MRVVYTLPATHGVTVRRDEVYRAGERPLTLDVYRPPAGRTPVAPPAVVFVTGFSDTGAERMLGCRFKEMASYVSWAELAAASGLAAITYVNQDPVADARAVLEFVEQHADALDIDAQRIGFWSSSGNVPTALSLLMERRGPVKCAVLCYGYTLDDGSPTGVADAARQFGFANPSAGRSVVDLPRETALFVARAGADQMPGLNGALDRFLRDAVAANLPVTFVNHATGPHAFDLLDDSEASRGVVAQILAFMQRELRVRPADQLDPR